MAAAAIQRRDAVGGLQYVSELAGRYKTFSPYISDTYKMTQKLTVDLGLRWDYLPPFHEVKNRWTFLNPTLTNPLTNSLGMLQFAGNYGGGGVSCGCRTPVATYWKTSARASALLCHSTTKPSFAQDLPLSFRRRAASVAAEAATTAPAKLDSI